MRTKTASARWSELDGQRHGLLWRCEQYSAYTTPRVCLPEGYDQNTTELTHDWQSIGAQAVNHLINKLMMALFAPSRKFFRIDISKKIRAELLAAGLEENVVEEELSKVEKEAIRVLDKKAMRPKLHDVLTHLVVVGNVLLILDEDPNKIRVVALRNYVVKRDIHGEVIDMVMKEDVTIAQLDKDIRELPEYAKKSDDECVSLFKWLKRVDGNFELTQWVDEKQLPKKFNGKWPVAKCPYLPLTWLRSDGADYGTGQVEDYVGEFAALSTLSKAETEAAVLASQYRWLVNPGGHTQPEDLERSMNGEAIPGEQGDITLLALGATSSLPAIHAIIAERTQRIGRGFLLGSAVTRDAERVTAEEMRMQAAELEASLGGAYARIAIDLQMPLAYYLLREVDMKIQGKDLEPMIITGLDALSRNGDLENTRAWLGDFAALQSLPPQILSALNVPSILAVLAAGRGVDSSKLVKSPAQIQAETQAMMVQQAQAQMAGGPGLDPAAAEAANVQAPPA